MWAHQNFYLELPLSHWLVLWNRLIKTRGQFAFALWLPHRCHTLWNLDLRVHTAHKRSQKVYVRVMYQPTPKTSVPIPRSSVDWEWDKTSVPIPRSSVDWEWDKTSVPIPRSSVDWEWDKTSVPIPRSSVDWEWDKTSVPIPRSSVDWEWGYTHYIHSTSSYPSFGHAQFRGGGHGIHVLAADLGSECCLLAVGDKPVHNLTRPAEQRDNLMWSLWSETRTKR